MMLLFSIKNYVFNDHHLKGSFPALLCLSASLLMCSLHWYGQTCGHLQALQRPSLFILKYAVRLVLVFNILQSEFVFSHYLCAIMRVHVASFNPEKIHPQTLGKSIFMFVFLLLPAPFLDCSLSSFLNLCQYNNYTLYFHCCIQTVLCSN